MSQLPVLAILVPLLSAPLCVMLRKPVLARILTTLVCLLTFLIASALYGQVMEFGPLSYYLGGWEPPWGIELRADAMTVLLLLVVTSIASVVIVTGIGENSHSLAPGRDALFYAAYLLCLTGLIGMTMTADAFNVFVFLEISSLSTYTLIALGRGRRAIRAALSYLMMGTVGATFILLGVGMLYQLTGSLNMADIAKLLPAVSSNSATVLAFGFLLVGIGLKVAVFPLHQWLPNAYAFAPSAASSFIAGTGTKVIYYLLIRFVFSVFGAALAFESLKLKWLLLPLSVVAMFAGSIAAIFQKDLKRLLAYSSVAQLGYLTLAVSLGTTAGVQAGLLHVLNHAVMKSSLFLVAAAILARIGSTELSALSGLGKKMPMTMAAFVVGGLGLIGVPGTAGFISKWYLVLAALDSGDIYVALLVLCSSLLAVVYVWRIIEIAYFQDAPDESSQVDKPPRDYESPRLLIPAWTLALASLYFGFFTDWAVGLTGEAAKQVTRPPSEQVATVVISGHVPLRAQTHHSSGRERDEGPAPERDANRDEDLERGEVERP